MSDTHFFVCARLEDETESPSGQVDLIFFSHRARLYRDEFIKTLSYHPPHLIDPDEKEDYEIVVDSMRVRWVSLRVEASTSLTRGNFRVALDRLAKRPLDEIIYVQWRKLSAEELEAKLKAKDERRKKIQQVQDSDEEEEVDGTGREMRPKSKAKANTDKRTGTRQEKDDLKRKRADEDNDDKDSGPGIVVEQPTANKKTRPRR